MNVRMAALFGVSLLAAGCATAPKPLRGEFTAVVPSQASAAQTTGDLVRWGGKIVAVTPDRNVTCFEILGRDLSEMARPTRAADESNGRFLACRQGFYDPAIFEVDRDVTVTGRVEGYELRPIGEYEYRYPRVAADVIYLWPERSAQDYYYQPSPFFGPGYRPWGFWGGYYAPIRAPYRSAPGPSKPAQVGKE